MLFAHPAHHIDMAFGIALEFEQRITAGLARLAAGVRFRAKAQRKHGGERAQRR